MTEEEGEEERRVVFYRDVIGRRKLAPVYRIELQRSSYAALYFTVFCVSTLNSRNVRMKSQHIF